MFSFENTYETVQITGTNSSNADIIFQVENLYRYGNIFGKPAELTHLKNSENIWVSNDVPTGYEREDGSYINGPAVLSVIAIDSDFAENESDSNNDYFEKVCKHEVGHAVGLRHTFESDYETDPEISALMYPFYDSSFAKNDLQTYDINELLKTYPQ